jgi:hypothetical protein
MLLADWDDKTEILGQIGFMKQNVTRRVASIYFLAACTSFPVESQQPPTVTQVPTIRVQSSLVLVDVISQDPKSELPVRDFKEEDFRMFDNRHEVPIATFDAGVRYATSSSDLQRRRNRWSLGRICEKGIALSVRT